MRPRPEPLPLKSRPSLASKNNITINYHRHPWWVACKMAMITHDYVKCPCVAARVHPTPKSTPSGYAGCAACLSVRAYTAARPSGAGKVSVCPWAARIAFGCAALAPWVSPLWVWLCSLWLAHSHYRVPPCHALVRLLIAAGSHSAAPVAFVGLAVRALAGAQPLSGSTLPRARSSASSSRESLCRPRFWVCRL